MKDKRRRFTLQVVLACFIGLITFGTSSAAPLSLESSQAIHVTPLMRFAEDPSHALSLSDITDPTEAKFQWTDAPGETRSMGIQHVTYWYELDLVNTSDVESWYLVNRWPHAYQFNVFFVPDDSLSPVQRSSSPPSEPSTTDLLNTASLSHPSR